MIPTLLAVLPEHGSNLVKRAEALPDHEVPSTARRIWNVALVTGKGALGIGVGTLAGYGLAEGLNRASKKLTGNGFSSPALQATLPALGTAMSIARLVYDDKMRREFGDAWEGRGNYAVKK